MPSDDDLERDAVIALAPLADLNVNVIVRQGVAHLTGSVDSADEVREAERLVAAVPGMKDVVNELDYDTTGYSSTRHLERLPEYDVVGELETEDVILQEQEEAEPTFMGEVGSADVTLFEDEEPVFFPPTDPVEHDAGRDQQGMELRDGWAPTSLTNPRSAENDPPRFQHSDYELLEEVIHALRNDASTQDLDIKVSVHDSVVHLHGTVPSLEDADNAEAVAASVDGVLDVVEGLEIEEPYIH